ncbi:hypothetical protein TFLX_01259 [Thermoflexales bacterium]|nr:hypothetical protein TFLX_01259 [Thermoflexales bacterium]
MRSFQRVAYRRLFVVLIVSLVAAAATLLALAATQTDLIGPVGSEVFGRRVVVLPNGNIVVTDPYYDAPGPITDTGAVYLYNSATGVLISRVTGGQANDQVGSGGVDTLTNGNYVVLSPDWDNGVATDAGAVTWGNGTTGMTGVVSITNSLVGGRTGDQVGRRSYEGSGVRALSNGNYVVHSPSWDNDTVADVGAATWGDGTTGITGVVSITNSLVGSKTGDFSGYTGAMVGVTALTNGNYVVSSPLWDDGAVENVGAVTWGNGTTGITGVVSVTNSLVGSTTGDRVGDYHSLTALNNGNYVVCSQSWDNGPVADAGAATWGNGTTGITGAVSVTNSLVGSTANDLVGYSSYGGRSVTELGNGNYMVSSPHWNNGAAVNAGAATWGNGTTGITGVVSIANSLVGNTADDEVGDYRAITTLNNGNYIVSSPWWDNGAATDAGAVTWGSGTTGITGVVSVTNSLVGNTADDMIGYGIFDEYDGVTPLSNGNYVVSSPAWDNGATANAGAATWGDGTTGITGVVSITNSLVGNTVNDRIGWSSVTALNNGNYVVSSPYWDYGTVVNVGAATWGNGTTGITGVVSITNSLVGGTAGDWVSFEFSGDDSVTALSNGNYVVSSPWWGSNEVGAVTWGNGTTGITGVVSITNSLVGSTVEDYVGYNGYGGSQITALSNGNYVVASPMWDNGVVTDTGAVTWGNGTTGITGVVSITNSLVGNTVDDRVGWDYSSSGGVTALNNGNYVVHSPLWKSDVATSVGAVTLGNGHGGTIGLITSDNSMRGLAADGGWDLNFDYDYTHNQLVVGRPADNIVTLLGGFGYQVYLPLVHK